MKVRYSYLPQQFEDCEDLWQDLKDFVATGDFTLGEPLTQFEESFAKLIGTKYAIGVNSGTDAIKLSLKALNIGPGDEVITAANTFVASVGPICELGATPVFVDCNDTFCMDTSLIEAKITEKTKAHFTLEDWEKTWMNDYDIESIFISALNKDNLEDFKAKTYNQVKKIHIERFPYNNFLYEEY